MAQSTAQPSLPQHRAQFSPPPNQPRDFPMSNGRANSFSAASPQMAMNYSSPSPQPFSSQYGQGPPQKRPRLSPDVSSSFPPANPVYSQPGLQQAASTIPSVSFAASVSQPSRAGLMAPPQKPVDKAEDRSYDDVLAGTGINIEEEERNLNRAEYPSQGAQSFHTANGSFGSYHSNSFGQPNGVGISSDNGTQQTQLSDEDRIKREHERADWEAARHAQHALWDMFLSGGSLNEKIKKFSNDEHLVEAQAGVLVNTQRNAPPPPVRVNGLEGASKIIDQGQSILDTNEKGERLSDIMKLVSLAAKSRLNGVLHSASRLAIERRQHSSGRVPDDWTDIAVKAKPEDEKAADALSPAGDASSKYIDTQTTTQSNQEATQHPAITLFEKTAASSRSAEEARLARRRKRKAKTTEEKDGADLDSADAALAAALDAEKKTTKKERKATESKFAEQQQHKNANEAARMATSSMIGRTFGKKGKSYSWMTGGAGGGASAAATPVRGNVSTVGTPGTATPGVPRLPAIPRGRRFESWDEDIDKGVTVRDMLLVMEQDPQALKSFVRSCTTMEGKEA